MVEQKGNNLVFSHKGLALGQITDPDELDRPDGSLSDMNNMDYDTIKGGIRTRNSTSDSGLLDNFSMPTGYEKMPDGVKLFSFNEPIDREVCLLFIKNTASPFDVRIYVNAWFNPPAPNTDGFNDYENHISSVSAGWQTGWIELTEFEGALDFEKTSSIAFNTGGSVLAYNGQIDYYKGWFAWNKTKWESGSTNQTQNESFACIESYDGTDTFEIQARAGLSLDNLGWNTGDVIYFMRYPIIVHKAIDISNAVLRMTFDAVQMVKTATSIKCLIGHEGNLWFGFVNKDTVKLDKKVATFINVNKQKRYGWWLDYETIPVIPDLTSYVYNGGVNYVIYLDAKVSFQIPITFGGAETTDKMVGISLQIDGFQHFCILKGMDDTIAKEVNWLFRPYHHYSRRYTAWFPYALDTTDLNADPLNNFAGNIGTVERFSGGQVQYLIFYDYGNTNPFTSNYPFTAINNGIGLVAKVLYNPAEPIFTKAKFGVYAQGRMFTGGDSDYPDTVRYSLLQRDDIFALEGQKPVDATDRDKNTAMDLLGINPVVFKNGSIHIFNIEGETEVGWRSIESRSRTGCPYPRTIARTDYGLGFANDEGYWLLQDAKEPINLLRGRRLQDWLALTNKDTFFAEWYGKHNEIWIYVGDDTFWVCKLNREEKMMGWKVYSFNFTPIGLFNDDSGDLFIDGTDFIYKYNNDDEVTNGEDADGTNIDWSFTPNYDTLGRYTPFHHIETLLNFKGTNRDGLIPNGNNETFNITVYKEAEQVTQVKTVTWNVSSQSPESVTVKNKFSDRQRAIKIKVNGQLNFLKQIEFTEINSRCKPVVTQVKSGYKEIAV